MLKDNGEDKSFSYYLEIVSQITEKPGKNE